MNSHICVSTFSRNNIGYISFAEFQVKSGSSEEDQNILELFSVDNCIVFGLLTLEDGYNSCGTFEMQKSRRNGENSIN